MDFLEEKKSENYLNDEKKNSNLESINSPLHRSPLDKDTMAQRKHPAQLIVYKFL
jgi:hypothetical protein